MVGRCFCMSARQASRVSIGRSEFRMGATNLPAVVAPSYHDFTIPHGSHMAQAAGEILRL